MTKNDILDYVRETPYNTNLNVLKHMLDDMGGSGGEGNIPLPEYDCTLYNWTEEAITLEGLDLNEVTDDFVLAIIETEEEEKIYLILNLETKTGIIFDEYNIVYDVYDLDSIVGYSNRTICYITEWPPEKVPPEYSTWSYETTNLNYTSYQYSESGTTINGFITDAVRPTSFNGALDLLSYVKIESTTGSDIGKVAEISGVLINNEVMPIANFYINWDTNSEFISKTTSYQYIFVFKDTPEGASGQCKLTWYGSQLTAPK